MPYKYLVEIILLDEDGIMPRLNKYLRVMANKFDTIVESFMRRVNQNTFIVNDRVTLVDNYLQHEWVKKQPQMKVDRIKEMVESGDWIRVSGVKTNKPVTAQTGHFEVVDDIWYDIVREAAPGLYTNVFTVPQELLLLHDDYPNEAPIPDNWKREDNSNIKPELGYSEGAGDDAELGPALQTQGSDSERNLVDKNVTLPGAKKPTDGESYTKRYVEH